MAYFYRAHSALNRAHNAHDFRAHMEGSSVDHNALSCKLTLVCIDFTVCSIELIVHLYTAHSADRSLILHVFSSHGALYRHNNAFHKICDVLYINYSALGTSNAALLRAHSVLYKTHYVSYGIIMHMNRDPFPPVESSCWKFIESMMSYIEIIVLIIDLSAPYRGLSGLSRYHFFIYVVILPCTM